MTVYTTVPADDSNLDVVVTEANDIVTIDIQPASFNSIGSVDSVNGLAGVVLLDTDDIPEGTNQYYTDTKVQTVIDTNSADFATTTYVNDEDDAVEVAANLYTDGAVTGLASTTYVDTQDGVTLSSANTYTDTSIAAIPAVDLSSYETIVNSEAGDANAIATAETYADDGDSATLLSANTYTDTSIAAIPATDLSAYSTTVEVEALPVSTFTNDAGYITSAPDSQTLSFATPNLTISDGNTVDLSALSGGNVTSVNTQIGDVVLDTDDITEGTTNLYHTDARSRDSISLTADTSSLTYDNVSGVFTYTDPTGSPAPASHLEIPVRNATGVTIPANSAVYISGVSGSNDLIELAVNTGTNPAMGVTTSSIATNSNGIMIIGGEIGSFNTIAYNENDALYLSSTAGELTNVRPGAETEFVQNVGRVVRSAVNGTIIVQGAGRANDVPNLDSLHVFIGDTVAPERRRLTYTDILNTPDLTVLDDVTQINPDSAGMTISDTGPTTVNWDFNNPLQWRKASSNAAVNSMVFDFPAAGIFTGMQQRTGSNYKMFNWYAFGDNGVDPADGSHSTHFSINGVNNVIKSRTHDEIDTDLEIQAETLGLYTGSGVSINGLYTFPNDDGAIDQVMSTDGAGQLSWVDVSGGGGGASSLEDLTDVSILNLENNDLLMYNSVASEWQNTNLGVSVTPILSGAATAHANLPYTLTVDNHAGYDAPAYFCELWDAAGTTLVLNNNDFTNNEDGTLTITTPAIGDYQIRVRCQDFGDLQSEVATLDVTSEAFGGTYRYWRITDFSGQNNSSNWIMVGTFRLFGSPSGAGTIYPPNMTTNTTPSPYVASASKLFSTAYDYFKAFDSNQNGSFWWNLGDSATAALSAWIQIDLGSSQSIQSVQISHGQDGYNFTGCKLYGSDTGAFAGEETMVADMTGLLTPWTSTDAFIIG